MRAKKTNRFADLKEKALGGSASDESSINRRRASARSSILDKRQEAVADITSGRARTIKVFGHDPARIRPWAGHNRDYGALSKERCQDLIEGFRRADQQFAAIVRKVTDSEDFDYEFICGARRHWTASYLKRDLIVEVRSLDDREAFLLQDIENRDREDISDYERACDYARALPVYFNNIKSHMAEQLQIDQGNFSRFLALAELPKEIVEAYADIRELLTHHGTQYAKFLDDPNAKKRLLASAKKLKGQGASGKVVMATLRQAAAGPGRPNKQVTAVQQHERIAIKQGRAGEYTVSFRVPTTNTQEGLLEIRRDLLNLIDELTQESTKASKGKMESPVS